jgi:hypothetical protein
VVRNGILYSVSTDSELDSSNISIENPVLKERKMHLNKVSLIEDLKRQKVNGKDWIKYYLFNPEEHGMLYNVNMKYKNKYFNKIGITKKDVKGRYQALTEEVEIISYKEYPMTMLESALIEYYIHHSNFKYREHLPKGSFNGSSECYYIDGLEDYNKDELLKEAILYLDKSGYPISSSIMNEILKERNINVV